jgi:hypothetical protein
MAGRIAVTPRRRRAEKITAVGYSADTSAREVGQAMGGSERDVHEAIRAFLVRVDKAVDSGSGASSGSDADFGASTPLFADGLGLDSLETAELSAVLEDEFGSDPFSGAVMPRTVGDIVAFYDSAVADA